MPRARTDGGAGERAGLGLWQVALYVVVALTILRLAFLRASPLELDSGEAERWVWGRSFAWGYGAAPPLTAWIEGLSSWLCGWGEACARGASPLLHAGTALILGATGVLIGGWRLGAWSMMAYVTLPGVALSSMFMTSAPLLLFFWAATLYAFLRLRRGGSIGWALAGGVAGGLGALASLSMLLFPLGAALHGALVRQERRRDWIKPALMLLVMLLVFLPHLFWRLEQGGLGGPSDVDVKPIDLLTFLAWQVVLFGPVPLYLLLRRGLLGAPATQAMQGEAPTQDVRRLLTCMSLPFIAVFLLLSALRPGTPGAAAFAYVAAVPLASAVALGGPGAAWMRGSTLVQGLIGVGFCALVWATPEWSSAPSVLAEAVGDFNGWRPLGRAIAREFVSQAPPARLILDGSLPSGLLLYYSRLPPGGWVLWDGLPDPRGQGEGAPRLSPGEPGPFLLIAGADSEEEISSHFVEASRVSTIIIPQFRNQPRRFDLLRLTEFRGYQP